MLLCRYCLFSLLRLQLNAVYCILATLWQLFRAVLVPRAVTNGNFPPDFVLSHSGYSESVCPYLLNIMLQISLEQNTCGFQEQTKEVASTLEELCRSEDCSFQNYHQLTLKKRFLLHAQLSIFHLACFVLNTCQHFNLYLIFIQLEAVWPSG